MNSSELTAKIEELRRLEKLATPGPWEATRRVTGSREPDHFAIEDERGRAILDTLNSEGATIHVDDEEGRGWDETGRKDLDFVASLRNSALPVIDSLLGEIERLRAENEWRAIESAPKDGTLILLASNGVCGTGYMQLVSSYTCTSHCFSARRHACPTEPDCKMAWMSGLCGVGGEITHWRPLPAPPALASTKGGQGG